MAKMLYFFSVVVNAVDNLFGIILLTVWKYITLWIINGINNLNFKYFKTDPSV